MASVDFDSPILDLLTKNINCSKEEVINAFSRFEAPRLIIFCKVNLNNDIIESGFEIEGENFKNMSLTDFFDTIYFNRIFFNVLIPAEGTDNLIEYSSDNYRLSYQNNGQRILSGSYEVVSFSLTEDGKVSIKMEGA